MRLERLYPYLARSPVSQRAIAARFFGRDLHRVHHFGFSHGPRWQSTAALKRLFAPALRHALAGVDPELELASRLPAEFPRWDPLAQAQYLEVKTLLSGYLLCSQGDRMLMASSVEGRFPFLDVEVMALANRLPASYKLRGLDEKHVLKRAFPELPEEILRRPKQPYRAPDLGGLFAQDGIGFAREALSWDAVDAAGVFDPAQVNALLTKCAHQGGRPLSNTDAMALVGVLSTQLLHEALLVRTPRLGAPLELSRDIDWTSNGQVEVGR
jgi:asparagine synthase (glutamine-hydrolysing)